MLIPAAALVAFFLFLTGKTYVEHTTGAHVDDGSCGCFGNLVQRSPAEAFWQDLLLLVPPLALAFLGRPAQALRHERARWIAVAVLTAGVLAFAWLAPGLPLDDLATRLRPGVVAAELCAGEDDGRICLDHVIPEVVEGEHVVVLTRLDDEAFLKRIDAFREYALDGAGPTLWVVVTAAQEDVDLFNLSRQPVFSVSPCPVGVIRPLYRTLPRSFLARDGRVVRTFEGWPPLASLRSVEQDDGEGDEPGGVDPESGHPEGDGSEGDGSEGDGSDPMDPPGDDPDPDDDDDDDDDDEDAGEPGDGG